MMIRSRRNRQGRGRMVAVVCKMDFPKGRRAISVGEDIILFFLEI
jgi:hypothetical protein